MRQMLARFADDRSGATAVEYSLIVALIAVAIIGAATLVGGNIGRTFNTVAAAMTK